MKLENMNDAVNKVMESFEEAKDSIKINDGETVEESINKTDDALNKLKGGLSDIIEGIDQALGLSLLKNGLLAILEASNEATSASSFNKMASKCRELINEEIENLEFWGNSDSIKKAVQLRALTEDERGKCVFESFASSCIYIGKKLVKRFRKWFDNTDEKSVWRTIGRGIGAIVPMLKKGIKFVWNATEFVVSYAVAGAIKITEYLFNAVKSLASKAKNWVAVKGEKLKADTEDKEVQ